ncbi:signal-transducing histidine kinase [Halosimplex carlsbadense 2-9-1]|uniref:Signal-transducing histidine kinase n=1 Tax=Halosimplex carlsbadense 2-9-1 TaxID=797114 RepID=M0CMD0_9EURY|nr:hybrid sensor histidine kinase/response regulator [Halosimplex carlsbadense]ELZ24411.1 signal-transducing histidine kinase [Halosimplex carlsbadense 2-9-1]
MSRLVDILLIEDNPGDAKLVEHYLDNPSVAAFFDEVALTHAETLTDGRDRLRSAQYDVVLLDLGLPESDGIGTLHAVTDLDHEVPVIVLTGLEKTEVAVEAIQSGAQDYLEKGDIDADRLVRSLRYAVERHEHERALARRNEQLDFFNSLLRHDLMNALNVMMARADMLESAVDDPELADHASSIGEWGRNIVDLTDKIRSILDTVADEGDDSLEPTSISRVVEEEADRVRSLSDRVDVVVDVPDADVLANDLLSDVVGNLLTNAVEHTDDRTTVTVDGEIAGPHATLTVADDGDGIPGPRRKDLFERGQKGGASSGTGFGLFFVSSMVESYDGSVRAEESDRGGAAFVLELPRA